jgi:hypothetical protein
MKIEIVVDPARPVPAQSLASRVAPPAAALVVNGEGQVVRLVKTCSAPRYCIDSDVHEGMEQPEGGVESGVAGAKMIKGLRRPLLTSMPRWRFVSSFASWACSLLIFSIDRITLPVTPRQRLECFFQLSSPLISCLVLRWLSSFLLLPPSHLECLSGSSLASQQTRFPVPYRLHYYV